MAPGSGGLQGRRIGHQPLVAGIEEGHGGELQRSGSPGGDDDARGIDLDAEALRVPVRDALAQRVDAERGRVLRQARIDRGARCCLHRQRRDEVGLTDVEVDHRRRVGPEPRSISAACLATCMTWKGSTDWARADNCMARQGALRTKDRLWQLAALQHGDNRVMHANDLEPADIPTTRSRPTWCSTRSTPPGCAATAGCWRSTRTKTASTWRGWRTAARIVLQFYRPGRWSEAQIAEERRFALELASAELPMVAPLSLQGRTLHRHAGFLWRESGARRPPAELDDPRCSEWIGRLLARLHQVGSARGFSCSAGARRGNLRPEPLLWLPASGMIPPDAEGRWREAAQAALALASAAMAACGKPDGIALRCACTATATPATSWTPDQGSAFRRPR